MGLQVGLKRGHCSVRLIWRSLGFSGVRRGLELLLERLNGSATQARVFCESMESKISYDRLKFHFDVTLLRLWKVLLIDCVDYENAICVGWGGRLLKISPVGVWVISTHPCKHDNLLSQYRGN